MSASPLIKFVNCRLIRKYEIIREDLWVRAGKIQNPEKIFFEERKRADFVIDCDDSIIAPGFIDLQINGGYGVDFSSDIDIIKGVNKVAEKLLTHGTTSFCPTIVTSPSKTYHNILPKIPKRNGGSHGATILGCHVEGPFISPAKKGAHPERYIKNLNKGFESVIETYGSLENIKIVTLAPEKDGAPEVIRELTARGITASLGHSMADLSHGECAAQNGALLITHLFNAMLPFHHRDPGLVGLLASDQIPLGQTMYFGIIADGVHTHPSALRIAHRTHPFGLILVTDAISAMGLEDGLHHIGQLDLEVRSGRAFIAGTDTLCGSITPMDECIRVFREATGCELAYAVASATLHPAKCLGIEKSKGTLNYEADADFVFLNDELMVRSTWIAGNRVFHSGKEKNKD